MIFFKKRTLYVSERRFEMIWVQKEIILCWILCMGKAYYCMSNFSFFSDWLLIPRASYGFLTWLVVIRLRTFCMPVRRHHIFETSTNWGTVFIYKLFNRDHLLASKINTNPSNNMWPGELWNRCAVIRTSFEFWNKSTFWLYLKKNKRCLQDNLWFFSFCLFLT